MNDNAPIALTAMLFNSHHFTNMDLKKKETKLSFREAQSTEMM